MLNMESVFNGIEGFDFGDFGLGEGFDFELEDFDLSNLEEPTDGAIYTRPVVRRPKTVAYENAERFARDLVIDNEHETFAFVDGSFVFGDFVEALVDLGKLSVSRMSIMTLSLNDENIDSIRNIVEWEGVERLDLALSSFWYGTEMKKGGLVGYLFDELDIEGLELHVGFASVHCKTWCIETRSGNHLTMQGSANLRSSSNIEQLHITPDAGVFEFVDGFTRSVVETYDVINQGNRRYRKKEVRGKRLWQAVVQGGAAETVVVGAGEEKAPKTDAIAKIKSHQSSERESE